MALPDSAYLLEDATHAYYTHFLSQDLAFTEEKAAFHVTFQYSRPGYPSTAHLELYRGHRADRGLAEARVLQQLCRRCPQVLQCYYSFQHKDEAYVFLEHCQGGNLRAKVRKSSSPNACKESKVRRLFHAVAAAVQKCHALGIRHGHLQLKSLLITEAKEVKIAGFGAVSEATEAKDLMDLAGILLEIAYSASIDLKSNESIRQALESIHRKGFSQGFTSFLQQITASPPNSASQLLTSLSSLPSDSLPQSLPPLFTCSVCSGPFPRCLAPPCSHTLCKSCLVAQLVRRKVQERPSDVGCSLCGKPLGTGLIASVLSALPASLQAQYEDHIRSEIQGLCPYCSHQFPILKARKGRWRPYDFTCQCRHCFCSYCGLRGGHKVVVFRRKCYVFEQEQGLRPGK